MMKRLLLPVILLILTVGFWASSDFQEIAAGVAIFLFGMLMLEDGFKLFSGGVLETMLEKATGSVTKSLGFGIVSTTIMQSSSLVSVITISFLSAGLISLLAGVGIHGTVVQGVINIIKSLVDFGRAWPSGAKAHVGPAIDVPFV